MFNRSKKGFTIVELIIVIAVIAVLAAVLIPTFSNLIQQAQEAKDTALVSDLNKGLAMSGTKFDTMHDALTAVESNIGINVAKVSATASDNKILYDSQNNCFVYLKNDKITYVPDTQKTPVAANEQYKYWEIVETAGNTAKYSQYLAGNDKAGELTVNTGFDAGNNTGIASVTYTSSEAQTVTIRTNGGILTVNAENATVDHYGELKKAEITKVANNSYHEFGNVNGDIVITKGHVVLENNASVGTVKVADAAVANEVKVSNNSSASIVLVDAGNKLSADSKIGESSVKVTDTEAVALIGNVTYKTLKDALDNAKDGDTVKLIADYRLTKDKNTAQDRLNINAKITLDFGNYYIYADGELGECGGDGNFSVLFVYADTVFIADNGGVISEHDNTKDDCGPYCVNVKNGAKLTIKSGYYFGGGTAVQVHEGAVEILGGKFEVEPFGEPYGYKYQINAIDANFKAGTATIIIKGGSFYKFDPANSKSENPRGEFTPEGYKVNCIDDWYTVIPE